MQTYQHHHQFLYASSPTLNSSGGEDNSSSGASTTTGDDWENSTTTSTSSNTGNADFTFSNSRIFVQNPNRYRSSRRKPARQRAVAPPEINPTQQLEKQFRALSTNALNLSSTSSDSSNSNSVGYEVRVTPQDVIAVDSCLRGHRTRVFVCRSMANLYTCPRASTATTTTTASTSWTLAYTGIPALILVRMTHFSKLVFGGQFNSKFAKCLCILLLKTVNLPVQQRVTEANFKYFYPVAYRALQKS